MSVVLLGTVAVVAGSEATQNAQANGDTRTLTLYHTHRGDTATITFKRNGRYDADGLKQLSTFLRDWRNNKSTRMEPRLFDIVWETHRAVGRGGMINIVSSYRSPETNAMLRARSSGVARFSQHMLGRAMDFYITGVPVSAVREAGMRLQRGGVGFYPTSGRPFVHLDAGNVRAWPRMSRSQLARLFPGGKTIHQPAEGGQMPGYQTALAELKSRGEISLDSAYSGSGSSGKSFFARLFGGADESEDEANTQVAGAPARGASSGGDDEGGEAAAPATAKTANPPATVQVATIRTVPVPMARPADAVRPAAAQAETMVASATPMPPIAPARSAQAEMQVAAATVPLPPVAPTVVAAKPVPLPPTAPSDGYQLASAEAADVGPDLVWRTGAPTTQSKPAGASEAAMALASTIPTPKARPTADSAVAVLAALPTPVASGEGRPREINAEAASAYQAEASTFPRLPNAFLGKRNADDQGEMTLAYAPQTDVATTGTAAQTRAAIAPQTRVTAATPLDPNVRVLSQYSTPAAVYAAATAPLRRRATLAAPESMTLTPLDEAGYLAFTSSVSVQYTSDFIHPSQSASLIVSPSAALSGGFETGQMARVDRFTGSSVMLLRTQSFAPNNSLASSGRKSHG